MIPLRFKAVCTETGREFGESNLGYSGVELDKWGYAVGQTWSIEFEDENEDPRETDVRKIQICQSTGLTDANGQEVFFGDVLQDLDGGLAVVAWDQKAAKFGLQYLTPDWLACDYASMYLEDRKVIGNRWMPSDELKARTEALAK